MYEAGRPHERKIRLQHDIRRDNKAPKKIFPIYIYGVVLDIWRCGVKLVSFSQHNVFEQKTNATMNLGFMSGVARSLAEKTKKNRNAE